MSRWRSPPLPPPLTLPRTLPLSLTLSLPLILPLNSNQVEEAFPLHLNTRRAPPDAAAAPDWGDACDPWMRTLTLSLALTLALTLTLTLSVPQVRPLDAHGRVHPRPPGQPARRPAGPPAAWLPPPQAALELRAGATRAAQLKTAQLKAGPHGSAAGREG